MLEEFGFHLADVDAGGAFGFASFAGEAEVHDFFDLFAVEGIGLGGFGEDVAEGIGSGTGGIFFVAGGHVAWAHDSAGVLSFPAVAGTVAEFGGLLDAFGFGEVEEGFYFSGGLAGGVTEVLVHGRRIHYFVGVEYAVRVPGLFEVFDQLVVLGADHEFEEFATEAAVAVLTAEGAIEFFDEGGDVLGDFAEEFGAFGRFEIDYGAEVDFARAGVGVVDALELVAFFEELVEAGYVFGEVLYIDGGVFDDGDWFGVAGDVGEETESGFAEIPDAVGVGAGYDWKVGPIVGGLEGVGYGLGFGFGGFCCVGPDFDDEECLWIALEEKAVFLLCLVSLGASENEVVHEFNAVGVVLDGDEISLEGFGDRVEVGTEESVGRWGRIEDL